MINLHAKKPLGVYVHIPFCIKKCNYCDFISYATDSNIQSKSKLRYMHRIKEELEQYSALYREKYIIDSIYYGGGTPTTVDAHMYSMSNKWINNAFTNANIVESTIEANPGTLDSHQIYWIQKAGFNRISLGVQSLDDTILKRLGRIHNSSEANDSYMKLKKITDNINVDLIFGLPGQTLAIWKETLKGVLNWDPAHISFYSLQLEEGTPFYEEYKNREMDLPSWDDNRSMYRLAVDMIKAQGYNHYEVSNAAKPGYECRHNMKYWTMQDYLGLGISSHSYLDGVRHANTSGLEDYLSGKFYGKAQTQGRNDKIGDYLFTELRQIKGFELLDYRQRFGADFMTDHNIAAELMILEGFLEIYQGNIRFTSKGLDNTNHVIKKLLDA